MGSYSQWRTGADKKVVRRFTWVCGSERVLAEEVVDTIRGLVSPAPHEFVTTSPAAGLWDELSTLPAPGSKRLVIVRSAEKLADTRVLGDLIAAGRELSGVYVIFVSAAASYPTTPEGELAPYIAALRDSSAGQLVKCSPLSEDDMAAWVQRRIPQAGKVVASYLWRHCGEDMDQVAAVCAKAVLFGDKINEQVVNILCQEQPVEGFADSLVYLRRAHALACAETMDEGEMAQALALLESRLDSLETLNKAVRLRMPPREMSMRLQLHPLVIQKFRDVAGTYDADRIRNCWKVLAIAEAAWAQHVREGVAEVLVALW